MGFLWAIYLKYLMSNNEFSFFDAVFVINMDNRPDRWETVVQTLTAYGFSNVERVSACRPDLSDISEDDVANFNYGPDRTSDFDAYRQGSIGCLQSHRKVLDLAIKRGYKNYLVFEDDVILKENTQEQLNRAIAELSDLDWDMFYLGGRHRSRRKVTPAGRELKRISCTYTTHAYAVNKGFYGQLSQELSQCKAEIDHFYAEQIHPKYNCFCIGDDIAFQSGSESSIKGGRLPKSKAGLKQKIQKWLS